MDDQLLQEVIIELRYIRALLLLQTEPVLARTLKDTLTVSDEPLAPGPNLETLRRVLARRQGIDRLTKEIIVTEGTPDSLQGP